MRVAPPTPVAHPPFVGMGEIVVAHAPEPLRAVLGSCIGLILYHPRLKAAALAHVVLPESTGRDGAPGKFADTAVPAALSQLQQAGVQSNGVLAKIAGGASMFGPSGPLQIGEVNAQAVRDALAKAGVRLVAEHVGGNAGRRIEFDLATGELKIDIVGRARVTL